MLGTEKIGKMLVKMSVPAIIGMLVNALYNVVDTIFIGRGVGTLGIGGLTVAFPMQLIIMSIGMLVGMGSASVISRSLGMGDKERASKTAGNAFVISIISGIIMMVLGLLLMKPILRILGATDELLPYAQEYLSVILYGAVFITFAMSANNIVRAEGRAVVAMITMFVGTGMNIILDPIFIFGLDMGIRGAAMATVISQFLSFAFLLFFFLSGKSSLKIKLHHLKPAGEALGEIFKLGIPIFVRELGMSILAIVVNNSLRAYGSEVHIAAFGVINRLLMFTLMPLMGLSQGFQPIAGYNYGAGSVDRVKQTVKISIIVSTSVATFAFVVMMLFARTLFGIFTADQNLILAGAYALRIGILVIPFVGLQLIGATYFLAIGKAIPSLLLGMSRQILFFIPLVLLLPLAFGLNGVWFAFPIADGLAALVTVLWLALDLKKLDRPAGEPAPVFTSG